MHLFGSVESSGAGARGDDQGRQALDDGRSLTAGEMVMCEVSIVSMPGTEATLLKRFSSAGVFVTEDGKRSERNISSEARITGRPLRASARVRLSMMCSSGV